MNKAFFNTSLITLLTMLCNIPAYAYSCKGVSCSTEKDDGDAAAMASEVSITKSSQRGHATSKIRHPGKAEKARGSSSTNVWDYN
ncbi:hypothetical protein [Paraburkholderia humisilvae]|uniref:Lipoprotein n=1 Tax=Paraburkholderia humisilvae TaxID=627669 RepID=A0A6J5CY96_9BURK|nr:hypothetical protein [Paraburkholderia humisilvae]CAB3745825.1 hypothetical protein LMG29542_00053 [Paraburkholderia humisilvae]